MTRHVLGTAYQGAVMAFRRMEEMPAPEANREAADEATVVRTPDGNFAIEATKGGSTVCIVLTPGMAETVAEILWRPC